MLIGTLAWAVAEVGLRLVAARGPRRHHLPARASGCSYPGSPATSAATRRHPAGRRRCRSGPACWRGVAVLVGRARLRPTTRSTARSRRPRPARRPTAGQPAEDWRAYGRTQSGQRYSPLTQITPANVKDLKVAWTFRTGDLPGPNDPEETTFEVTPIKVGDTLYLCSQHQRLFALDAATGKLRWSLRPAGPGQPDLPAPDLPRRLLPRDRPGRDHADGAPARPIARADLPAGQRRPDDRARRRHRRALRELRRPRQLNLEEGMGDDRRSASTSHLAAGGTDKILVVAGAVIDNYSTDEPSGVIRGFDVHTGRLVWAWDPGAAGRERAALGRRTPTPTTRRTPGSRRAPRHDLGLVYLPMGVHTPDIWGGDRDPADERYSSSLVALDVNDRQARLVVPDRAPRPLGHGPAVPAEPGRLCRRRTASCPPSSSPPRPATSSCSTAAPASRSCPAPEHPVPQGAAPGDHVSPTQPFSELTFRPAQNLTGADMWGATIFDQLACRIMFHRLRYEGPFTPPSEQGTLVFPGNLGMFEWGGIARRPGAADRDRQPDRDPLRLEARPARPGQPGGAQRRAPARHASSACSRCTARPSASMLQPVPVADRPALPARRPGATWPGSI